MGDVKWIKIVTDIFDDEKILLIESLPEADSIIVIWFKLLCLAGKQNNSGVFVMSNGLAYTDKMLATIFRRKESTVNLALRTFEEFGMIEIINDAITIPNWSKHQTLDQLEERKEYMREYMKKYREKQKLLTGNDKLCEVGLPLNEWKEVLTYFEHKCAYCGCEEGLEQEHIVPVNNGGKYVLGNIVPSCRSCNASKGAKDLEEWYKKSEIYDIERHEKICSYMSKYLRKHLRKANVNSLDKEEEIEKEIEIEEDKNNKKVSKKTSFDNLIADYTSNVDLQVELKNHLATRKSKKATLTNRAIELSFKKLDELVKDIPINDQEEMKIKIVQQSIERGWTGFFEVKDATSKQCNNKSTGNPFFDLLREEGKM